MHLMRLIRAKWRNVTRGCTLFPEGDYTPCCDEHDVRYTFGKDRRMADRELRECIKGKRHPALAWLVWIGVRLFGYPFWYFGHRKGLRQKHK